MRHRLFLLLFLSLIAFFLPQAGKAQAEIQLDRLEIKLWPEYDRADMLVIYNIALPADALPADLTFRLPKAAGEPNSVAYRGEDGNLYSVAYDYQAGDEWGQVSFRTNSAIVQMEYYDPGLFKQGVNRSFTYAWPGDYSVNSATLSVQQPPDARNIEGSEKLGEATKGDDNLLYYTVPLGKWGQGETYNFYLKYQKPSDQLTVGTLLPPVLSELLQENVLISSLDVNLWPEYDRKAMLVIYKITLAPETDASVLTFRIPKEAGRPFKVATWAEDGNLYETPSYTFQEGKEWGEVSFEVKTARYQLEYYDPRLEVQDTLRNYRFTWPGDYAVTAASISVQQPLDASEMEFSVGDVSIYKNIDDMNYYTVKLGTLSMGEKYEFELSYQKTTDTLTYEEKRVQPQGLLPQSMWSRGLPWAAGLLALALIAGGVWVYWRSGQPQSDEKKRRKKKVSRKPKIESAAEDTATYCHSCGRRANPGDGFCRSCGTKLRI